VFPGPPNRKKVRWDITNNGSDATLIQINIEWPGGNDLLRINFGGSMIWEGREEEPPATIEPLLGDRTISFSATKMLEFVFQNPRSTDPDDYSITVTFTVGPDNECTVSFNP